VQTSFSPTKSTPATTARSPLAIKFACFSRFFDRAAHAGSTGSIGSARPIGSNPFGSTRPFGSTLSVGSTPSIGSIRSVGLVVLSLAAMGTVLTGCSSDANVKSSRGVANSVSSDSVLDDAVASVASETVAAETTELLPAVPVDETQASRLAPVVINQISGEDLVPVIFDFPDTARPIKEIDRPIADGTKRLALKVSGLTYHGVVCGFSIKGTRPESPALIRMTGTKADGTGFDSGSISVAWTSTEPPEVSSGGADNNGWNFLSDANPNRSGPGWVVSLGGVTPDGPDSIPKFASCSLELGNGTFSAANGPVGYWAGFARN
jgi:hypothetical protein